MEFVIPIILVVLVIAIGVGVLKSRGETKKSSSKSATDRAKQQSDANLLLASLTKPQSPPDFTGMNGTGAVLSPKSTIVAKPTPTPPVPVTAAPLDPFKAEWESFRIGYRKAFDNLELQVVLDSSEPTYDVEDLPLSCAGGTRITLPMKGVLPSDELRYEVIVSMDSGLVVNGKRGQWSGVFLGSIENNTIVICLDSKEAGDMSRFEVRLLDVNREYRANRTITHVP